MSSRYDRLMAAQFPAVMAAGAEVANQRDPFHVARRFQDVSESHPAGAESIKSQLATFIDANRSERCGDATSNDSGTAYMPLVSTSEIRVLEILPANFAQQIQGRLHHVSVGFALENARNERFKTNFALSMSEATTVCYTALSYVWGPPLLECSIDIGNHSLGITKSLDKAIRHLRHGKDSMMVWIDQICINQNDLAEKTSQVQLMSLIYQRAWNTVIWLSEVPADDAFDALQELQNLTTHQSGPLLDAEKESLFSSQYLKPGGYEAIERLFSAPWFQRTWTIQEAVLSNSLWVMTGTSTCNWEDSVGCTADNLRLGLFEAMVASNRSPDTSEPLANDVAPVRMHGFHAANAIWNLKMQRDGFLSKMHLLMALVDTRHTQATNPLDNVYGILGLCESSIIPDYTMKATELWQSVSVQILKAEIRDARRILRRGPSGFDYLSFSVFQLLCCIDHDVDSSGNLPSWAVDWSKPRVTTSLAYSTSALNCFYAGKSSTGASVFRINECENTLVMNAKMFDTIDHLSIVLKDAELEAHISGISNTALRTCIAFAQSAPSDLPTKTSFLGFCMVLTAGKDGTGMQRYPAGYTEILGFLSDAITGQSPTFPDQVYTPRQQKGRLTLDNLKRRSCGRTFQDLKASFRSAVLNRRLCWTKKGHFGLVPRFAKQGDCVAVVPGSPVPFVMRRVNQRDDTLLYRLVGESYIDGIMHGEVMADNSIKLIDVELA